MSYRRRRLTKASWGLRLLRGASGYWFLILLGVFFASPIGPHLRIEYSFRQAGDYRSYISCSYLGSRGLITPGYIEGCPVFAWIDARPWVR